MSHNVFDKSIKLKYIIFFLLSLAILLLIFGCDNMNCRPDGKIENKQWDWFAGFRCKGEF